MQIPIIVGRTASGKSTILEKLCEEHGYTKLVTTTTRDPRPGEIDGVHYHFLSKEQFEEKLANNGFVEHVFAKDNYYGTGVENFDENNQSNKPIVILEPIGAKVLYEKLKEFGVEPVSIFIDESLETCLERVKSREADPEEVSKRILELTTTEMGWEDYMDYDFKTKPNSTIQENCNDILEYLESKVELKNKIKKRISRRP